MISIYCQILFSDINSQLPFVTTKMTSTLKSMVLAAIPIVYETAANYFKVC